MAVKLAKEYKWRISLKERKKKVKWLEKFCEHIAVPLMGGQGEGKADRHTYTHTHTHTCMPQNTATVVHHQPGIELKGKARERKRGWQKDRSEREQNKISPSKERGEGLHRLSLGSEDLPQVSVSSPSPSVSQVRWHC